MRRAAIDIETVRIDLKNAGGEETRKDALDPLKARVICVGLIELDNYRAVSQHAFIGLEEREVLEDFWTHLRDRKISRFVAHNGLNFDLPFLWKRSVINKVRPSVELDLRKYRNDFLFDTMNVWSNWETRSSLSLDELSRALGFEGKTGNGSAVEGLWMEGAFDQITEYCVHDCWLAYACFCRMNFAEPIRCGEIPTQIRYGGETASNVARSPLVCRLHGSHPDCPETAAVSPKVGGAFPPQPQTEVRLLASCND